MNKMYMASTISSGYAYPSIVIPASIVSIKLLANNYSRWETQMLCLLESQDLVGFIDGTIPKPPETISGVNAQSSSNGNGTGEAASMVNEDYMMWKRSDRLVKGWILGSLSEDILDTVLGLSTAKDVWEKLRAPYFQESKEEEIEQQLPPHKGIEYPYPYTFNVANFVTIKLSKVNYKSWVLQILSLVDILELRNFLMNPPPSQDYDHWKRTDMLLRGWILGSISEDVFTILIDPDRDHFSTSRSIMLKIEITFVPDITSRVLSPKPVTTEIENNEEEIEEELPTQHVVRVKEYPYPSTFNVANFVTIKLIKANYKLWVKQIFLLVDILELRNFLLNPPPVEVEDYNNWKRTDRLLQGWILSSISEDVFTIVNDPDTLCTSKRIMAKIEETFDLDIDGRILSQMPEVPDIGYNISRYMPLYKAAVAGDWEAAKIILDRDNDAATAFITENNLTLLHVAVATGKAIHFVSNLVQHLPTKALSIKGRDGNTALGIAASVGNTQATKILIENDLRLLFVDDNDGLAPLHYALLFQHRDTYLYLRSMSPPHLYGGHTEEELLSLMIYVEYFDLALDLVKHYPHALKLKRRDYSFVSSATAEKAYCFESPLSVIAEKSSCFRSGMCLNFLESFIYSCVPVKFENYNDRQYVGNVDVENPANKSQTLLHDRVHFLGVCNRLNLMLWDVIELLVPSIKNIRQKKLVHYQAVQLVKCLCEAVKPLFGENSFYSLSSEALTKAARFGTHEVVEEILHRLPHTIWSRDESRHTITEIAVINRCEKVFNIIYQKTEIREYLKFHIDGARNNMLHLVGQLAPPHKLNLVSGAALQMQRELQWFKEVEKLAPPTYREARNSAGETPAMVFTREHKELVIAGEKWMKDTATSCTIAAALIITVVFAAAITVPGGNNGETGLPIFRNKPAFLLFAVSDAISLFTSSTSLFMFLSILTARYAEQDFLHALPKRLIFGLLTLFLSITTMIIAFSSTVYLMFDEKRRSVIIPLATLSFLLIAAFVRLQFPLLIDVYSSTYGRGIFGKQSNRPFQQRIRRLWQYIVRFFTSTQK